MAFITSTVAKDPLVRLLWIFLETHDTLFFQDSANQELRFVGSITLVKYPFLSLNFIA